MTKIMRNIAVVLTLNSSFSAIHAMPSTNVKNQEVR